MTPPAAARRRSWPWRYRRLIFLLGLGAFTGMAGATYVIAQVPLPPERPRDQTTVLLDAKGRRLASLDVGENRVSVALANVPDVVVEAVVATEDKNFFEHAGVDPVGLARATVTDIRRRGAAQGGSTITQQYVKNTFVGRERTVGRKLKEAVLALKLERRHGKKAILERYLNTVYFGRGAYGVQAAARAYFGKDVGELTAREAAYLAGLIRAPEGADPDLNPSEADRRRDRTLDAMVRNGFLDDSGRRAAKLEPVSTYAVDRREQEPTVVLAEKGTTYFVEHVRQQLVARFGPHVLRSGYRVTTTLDLDTQTDGYDAVYGTLDRAGDPAGALIAVDDTGAIRAMVGGRDYAASRVNLAVGREGGGTGRQAGSTFKPFLLAQTVKEGYTVQSTFGAPAEIVLPKANAGKDWRVHNYENTEFSEPMNLVDATRLSVNTVYAQLVKAVGEEDLVTMATDLGVSSPLQPYPSLVLGTVDVAVLDMAAAYSTFANRGVRHDPHSIQEIRDAGGTLVSRHREAGVRVLDAVDADVVSFCLRQVVERGTGTGARFGKPAAGKTGTTQDYGDAWFVGYTPKLTAAVWMGYPEGNSRKMTNVRGRKVTGGSLPADIFRKFMTAATKGVDAGGFPTPTRFPGKVVKGDPRAFTTSTSTAETSTSVPDPPPTTTVPPASTPTTKPAPATTTTKPPATTTTTAPAPSTTTTAKRPQEP